MEKILENEREKDLRLKNHKQSLSIVQIHKMLLEKGFDISYSSVDLYVKEKRVKIKEAAIRQEYEFDSFEQAEEHLEKILLEMNKSSLIEDEKKKLLKLKPKYDLAKISTHKVDSYSFVTVNKNKYSLELNKKFEYLEKLKFIENKENII